MIDGPWFSIRRLVTTLALLLAIGLPSITLAESSDGDSEYTIVTDRPDVSESSTTVPTNRLQLELGTNLSLGTQPTTLGSLARDNDISFPRLSSFRPVGLLARYGVADMVEVRLSTMPVTVGFPPLGDARATALPTTTVGAKVATSLNDNLRVGVLPWATVTRSFESNNLSWSAGALGTLAYDISPVVGFATNIGAGTSPGLLGGNTLVLRGSATGAFSLSDAVTTYAEIYGSVYPGTFGNGGPGGQGGLGGPGYALGTDAGVTYLVTPTFQLDAYADVDLPDARTVTVGVGASFLL